MEKDKALETLKAADRRVSLLRDSIAVLSFDMETVMPERRQRSGVSRSLCFPASSTGFRSAMK